MGAYRRELKGIIHLNIPIPFIPIKNRRHKIVKQSITTSLIIFSSIKAFPGESIKALVGKMFVLRFICCKMSASITAVNKLLTVCPDKRRSSSKKTMTSELEPIRPINKPTKCSHNRTFFTYSPTMDSSLFCSTSSSASSSMGTRD